MIRCYPTKSDEQKTSAIGRRGGAEESETKIRCLRHHIKFVKRDNIGRMQKDIECRKNKIHG